MGTLGQESKDYEAPKTSNIADLEVVRLDSPIEDREGTDKDNKTFKYKVMIVDGIEYRVPGIVMGDIKAILEIKPETKCVKVTRKGTGLGTTYNVIQLD